MVEELLLSLNILYLAGTWKLIARFVVPFRMMERIGKTAYRLDLRGRFKDVHNVLYVSQLKKHIPRGSSANPPEKIQIEGEEHFKVEGLLQHRNRGNSW